MKIYATEGGEPQKPLRKQDVEANLLAIIENSDALVYSLDRDFRYMTINSALKNRLKLLFDIDVKVGDKSYAFLEDSDPGAAKEWEDIYLLTMNRGETLRFVKEFGYDGRQEFWSFSINPIRRQGVVTGLSCFVRDVTELRKTRIELEKSEERYRLVSENRLLGIGWASLAGDILHLNETFCKMLGYTMEEMKGIHYSRITHVDDMAFEAPLFQGILNKEIDHYRLEKRYFRKDGRQIWVDLNLTRVRNRSGEDFCIGIIQDITQRKEAEDAILKLNEELEEQVHRRTTQLKEAYAELESFSYSVSHDLRSPLRLINGFVKLLASEMSDRLKPNEREYLEIIGEKVVRMDILIRDMLKLSMADKAELAKDEVDMHTLVLNVLEELNYAMGGHNADIYVKDLPAGICDGNMIKQVWINLIGNAIKYSSKKLAARIEIGSTIINEEIVYYVKDNGAGFDMRHADTLFRAFNRLHHSQDFEGTGVGLALVNRIITKHGGKIWGEAKVNEGATFYFSLSCK